MATHHHDSSLHIGDNAHTIFALYFISKKYTESGTISGKGAPSRKLCPAFSVLFSECFDF